MKYVIIIIIAVLLVGGAGFYFLKYKENNMGIKDGSKVSINYTLKVDDKVVDSSEGKEPLNYTQGSGEIIPGLEKQLVGMKKGDKKSVTVSAADGYGEREEQLIQKVPRAAFKDGGEIKVGEIVSGKVSDHEFQATIVELNDKEVTLDLNHPLAGKTLNFDVEIVNVQ